MHDNSKTMASSDLDQEWKQHADNSSSEGSKPMDTEKAGDGEEVRNLNTVVGGSVVDPVDETTPATEYPHGTRLVLIMISLMLSIFLVSLDNVSR
jgi:hypothetical protein